MQTEPVVTHGYFVASPVKTKAYDRCHLCRDKHDRCTYPLWNGVTDAERLDWYRRHPIIEYHTGGTRLGPWHADIRCRGILGAGRRKRRDDARIARLPIDMIAEIGLEPCAGCVGARGEKIPEIRPPAKKLRRIRFE